MMDYLSHGRSVMFMIGLAWISMWNSIHEQEWWIAAIWFTVIVFRIFTTREQVKFEREKKMKEK
jgi:hypothetical protein